MATPHNAGNKGDFAKTVLMPGDPLRAKFMAENFLENPRLVTSVRNIYGYTGTYKGHEISVMASGMGMPSIGIYSYELYTQYDVENIIRIGSAGAYNPALNVLDVCVAEYSYSDSTFAREQCGYKENILYPSKELNDVILKTASELGTECKKVKVQSSDVFYTEENMGTFEEIAKRTNTDCVEMESFALFSNARVLGKKAACILTISDSFVLDAHISTEEREKALTKMLTLSLEAGIKM